MRRRLIGDNGRAVCSAVSFFIQDSKTRKSENYDYQPGKFIIHYTEVPARGQSSFGRESVLTRPDAQSVSAETTRSAGPVLDCEASRPSCDKQDGSRPGRAKTRRHTSRSAFSVRHTGTRDRNGERGNTEEGSSLHGRRPLSVMIVPEKNVCFRGDYSPNAFLAPSLSGLTSSTFLKYWSASSLLPFLE